MSKPYRYLGTWRAGRSNWRLQILSIFSLAVAFVCLASALLVVTNLAEVRDRWSRAGRATIYLHDNASEDQIQGLLTALKSTEGVSKARYVDREAARKEVMEESADQQLAALPAEAFPVSVELHFKDTIDDAQLGAIALKLRSLPTVRIVETYQRWTERLSHLLSGGVTASLFLALVVFLSVISVVASTMRLLLERRRPEVEVLRLVGATSSFVCRPFVVEGAFQGAMGAALAVGLVGVLYSIVRGRFDGALATLLGVHPSFLPLSIIAAMIVTGALMGATTAYVSLRKAVRA